MRGAVNEKSVSAIPSKIDGAMNNSQKSQGTHKALRGASLERESTRQKFDTQKNNSQKSTVTS
jgi:hypothetical protein